MKNLGKKARDKITGFEGIIIGKTTYLYGCGCYGITPKAKEDGSILDTCWFDEGRVEIIGEGVTPDSVRVEQPGGDNLHGPNRRVR